MDDKVATDHYEGDRYYAAAMHVTVMISWVFGLLSVNVSVWTGVLITTVPIVMWLAKSGNPFIHQHGKNLLKFILFATLLMPMFLMFTFYGAGAFFDAKGYTAETRSFFLTAERVLNTGDLPFIAFFTVGLYMIEGMQIHTFFKILAFGFTIAILLRPIFAPLRGAWRAYKGQPSDYSTL